jgi:hypothetical protein
VRAILSGYLLLLAAGIAAAQSGTCLDVGDEPHHQLVFQNHDVRVLLLELPRLAATQSYCHSHPYVYIIAGSGTASNTVEGQGTMSHDWSASETRVVYSPMQHVVRNESMNPHRELVVEMLHNVTYNPLSGNYDNDLFPSDLGGAKPTWTVSFSLGAMTASKNQLAPGAELSVTSGSHVLLAISDLELRKETKGKSSEALEMAAQEVNVLPSGSSFTLVNASPRSANFILLEF